MNGPLHLGCGASKLIWKDVKGVHEDREIQLSQRFHQDESRAIAEGLSWKIFWFSNEACSATVLRDLI
jgi:hypothetical protein